MKKSEALSKNRHIMANKVQGRASSWLLRKGPQEEDIPSGQRKQICFALRPVPARLHGLLTQLTDTHNHMAGFESERSAFNRQLRERMQKMHAREYCVMCVEPADWPTCTSEKWPRQPSKPAAVSGFHLSGPRILTG